MGVYTDRILPRLVHRACSSQAAAELRAQACAGLAGRVVEIGFGSGLNVAHYPASVTGVDAVEPSDLAWELSVDPRASSPIPIERVALDAQALPLPDSAYDGALSTWVLCTVPDLGAALAEIKRVLRPGALLHFVEHGLAPDPAVVRWQRRLDPLQQRLAGGCHLTRVPVDALAEAGFEVLEVERTYERGAPKPWGALSLGTARRPL